MHNKSQATRNPLQGMKFNSGNNQRGNETMRNTKKNMLAAGALVALLLTASSNSVKFRHAIWVATPFSGLILLKSVNLPQDMDWVEAARQGFVDSIFPKVIRPPLTVEWLDFRQWRDRGPSLSHVS